MIDYHNTKYQCIMIELSILIIKELLKLMKIREKLTIPSILPLRDLFRETVCLIEILLIKITKETKKKKSLRNSSRKSLLWPPPPPTL